jgi:hypothetical protein
MVAMQRGPTAPTLRFVAHRADDSGRIVDAYHGTDPDSAQEIVAKRYVRPSQNPYDWLGHGAYFWEESPLRAREWALRDGRDEGDVAVVAAKIRLGRCLNLVDARYNGLVVEAAGLWEASELAAGRTPVNNRAMRGDRNCNVFNFLCANVDVAIDTIRAVFPEGDPVAPGMDLLKQSHIHLCVRSSACIVGLELFRSPPQGPAS